jgi:hypothetical protein
MQQLTDYDSTTVFARLTITNIFPFFSGVGLDRQINTSKMKHSIPFKHFDYAIPFADTHANRMGSGDGSSFDTHLPPLKVSIDFEKRELILEGKDFFERDSIQKPQPVVSNPDNARIRVKATIYSGFTMKLSEFTKDELVFSMDGILDDGKKIGNCSGLLVFSKPINRNGSEAGEYHLTIYLYDDSDDKGEIKLRLTMYAFSKNALFN